MLAMLVTVEEEVLRLLKVIMFSSKMSCSMIKVKYIKCVLKYSGYN